jgi:membrane protein implicated in regulation of membrane protease activity
MTSDGAEIGCVGVVTLATRGSAGPGEVHIRIRGGTETYRAWSEDPLARGTTVLVVASRGARTVDVEEWVDVLGEGPKIPGLAEDDPIDE